MAEQIKHYMSLNPPPVPPIEVHEVRTDARQAGLCAFASREVERGEVVCEYVGEKLRIEDAEEREAHYEQEGRTCTLMVLENAGNRIAIDPYGTLTEGAMSWGASINHSRNHANLKPVVMNRNTRNPRVFFVAVHDIPETVEFLWNYNDPDWEFHANSQTLPE